MAVVLFLAGWWCELTSAVPRMRAGRDPQPGCAQGALWRWPCGTSGKQRAGSRGSTAQRRAAAAAAGRAQERSALPRPGPAAWPPQGSAARDGPRSEPRPGRRAACGCHTRGAAHAVRSWRVRVRNTGRPGNPRAGARVAPRMREVIVSAPHVPSPVLASSGAARYPVCDTGTTALGVAVRRHKHTQQRVRPTFVAVERGCPLRAADARAPAFASQRLRSVATPRRTASSAAGGGMRVRVGMPAAAR